MLFELEDFLSGFGTPGTLGFFTSGTLGFGSPGTYGFFTLGFGTLGFGSEISGFPGIGFLPSDDFDLELFDELLPFGLGTSISGFEILGFPLELEDAFSCGFFSGTDTFSDFLLLLLLELEDFFSLSSGFGSPGTLGTFTVGGLGLPSDDLDFELLEPSLGLGMSISGLEILGLPLELEEAFC